MNYIVHRLVLCSVILLTASGCSALKGTMLDGRLCTAWTAADVPGAVSQVVETLPEGTDKKKVQEALVKAQAIGATGTAICELIRAVEAAKQPTP